MDKANSTKVIQCPKHPSLPLQRVDIDPSSKKSIYCLECMLENKHANSLYVSLPTLPEFLKTSAITFHEHKGKLSPTSGPPEEYLQAISNKNEDTEKLKIHIDGEKKKVEAFFTQIRGAVLAIINHKRADFIKLLDNQLVYFNNNYKAFEKELKRAYPKKDDIDAMFPTHEELELKLKKVNDAPELETFIKEIKEQLSSGETGFEVFSQSEEGKRARFDDFVKTLKEIENIQPFLEEQNLHVENTVKEIKQFFEKLFSTTFILLNPIPDIHSSLDLKNNQGPITSADDFATLKQWLAPKFAFNPKLIYKGSRDGLTPEVFHLRCDGKGPTITIIKCQFSGSSQVSLIGGFLDQDWHQKNAYIYSEEAFVFSLSLKMKCPISQPQYAAQGFSDFGPIFGVGHDIIIAKDLTQSYVSGRSYKNSTKIIQSENYCGVGRIYFTPQDLEVYTIL